MLTWHPRPGRRKFGLVLVVAAATVGAGPQETLRKISTSPAWPDRRVEFVAEQSFGADAAPEREMLARVSDLAVDDDGNIYLLDVGDMRLVSFAPDGSFRWEASREGQGPGELNRPRGLALDGDTLYVLNQSGTLIEAWNTDGGHVEGWRTAEFLDGYYVDVHRAGPRRLLLTGITPGERAVRFTVVERNPDWTEVSQGHVTQDDGGPLAGRTWMGGDTGVAGDHLAVGSVWKHEFFLVPLDNTPVTVIGRVNPEFVGAVVDEASRSGGTLGSVGVPLHLRDGRWLVTASWPTGIDPGTYLQRRAAGEHVPWNPEIVIELYDRDGTWLTVQPAGDDLGYLMTTDTHGKVYAYDDFPYPRVIRYALEVSER